MFYVTQIEFIFYSKVINLFAFLFCYNFTLTIHLLYKIHLILPDKFCFNLSFKMSNILLFIFHNNKPFPLKIILLANFNLFLTITTNNTKVFPSSS
jgi:hypothetical protein